MADPAAMMDSFLAAVRARNVPSILDHLTDDAVFLMPNRPAIQGKAAVRNLYEQFFAQVADFDQSAVPHEIQELGDWAYVWGEEELRMTIAGRAVVLKGFGMSVLRRGDDGRWRFARGINNLAPVA